jgi:predicted RNA binding protein YcfA (HicA-like mRNA interferase family)
MPHLPVVSGDEFVKALRKIGYVWDHTEGSHMILYHPSKVRLTVPRHKVLSRGLLRALIRDASLSPDEFSRLLKD